MELLLQALALPLPAFRLQSGSSCAAALCHCDGKSLRPRLLTCLSESRSRRQLAFGDVRVCRPINGRQASRGINYASGVSI